MVVTAFRREGTAGRDRETVAPKGASTPPLVEDGVVAASDLLGKVGPDPGQVAPYPRPRPRPAVGRRPAACLLALGVEDQATLGPATHTHTHVAALSRRQTVAQDPNVAEVQVRPARVVGRHDEEDPVTPALDLGDTDG